GAQDLAKGLGCDLNADAPALGHVLDKVIVSTLTNLTSEQPLPLGNIPPQFAQDVAYSFHRALGLNPRSVAAPSEHVAGMLQHWTNNFVYSVYNHPQGVNASIEEINEPLAAQVLARDMEILYGGKLSVDALQFADAWGGYILNQLRRLEERAAEQPRQ